MFAQNNLLRVTGRLQDNGVVRRIDKLGSNPTKATQGSVGEVDLTSLVLHR